MGAALRGVMQRCSPPASGILRDGMSKHTRHRVCNIHVIVYADIRADQEYYGPQLRGGRNVTNDPTYYLHVGERSHDGVYLA